MMKMPSAWMQHAARDQPLAPDVVGERTGAELAQAPDGGVDRRQDRDLVDAQTAGGEEEREEAPGHAVVEVVDQTRPG